MNGTIAALKPWFRRKLTFCRVLTVCGPMKAIRRLLPFVLLAVWLAAGQHCVLEAAGILSEVDACGQDTCCDEQNDNSHERCNLAEGDSFSAAAASVKVPSPQLLDSFILCDLFILEPAIAEAPPTAFAGGVEQPLDWVPSWSFHRRAALSPRAPSLSLA